MVTGTTEIEYLLTVNSEMTYNELRKLEMSLIRILSLVKRFCGDENVAKAIGLVEKLIMIIRMCQIAIHALEAAAGPIGWLYAITTAVGMGIAAATFASDLGGA
jgi:hypothetical protein